MITVTLDQAERVAVAAQARLVRLAASRIERQVFRHLTEEYVAHVLADMRLALDGLGVSLKVGRR